MSEPIETTLESINNPILNGIWSVLVACFRFLPSLFKPNYVNKFWKPLKGKDISIVLTEYPITGDLATTKRTPDSSVVAKGLNLFKSFTIAKKVSDGYLVSKGNAKALSNITMYLSKHVTMIEKILVEGDNYNHHKDDLVILGSPVNNKRAADIISKLKKYYDDIPFNIEYKETGKISIIHKNGKTFTPKIDNEGSGCDYAVIINAGYEINNENKNVVILSGAHMYGTEAASRVVTNKNILKTIINKKEININSCIFLIETKVEKHIIKEYTLNINDNYYIFPLIKKKSG